MAPNRILAAMACATLVATGTLASADEYRAGEFLGLDLSKAVLSPKLIGPPAEFARVPVEARTDAKQVVAEPKVERQRVVRNPRVTQQMRAERPRTSARAKLARRPNPLDAQAMDRSIQTWPCKSGGICNWKR